MKSWYLIQTKPRQENLARENLERQGYRIYLPRILLTRRRKGRRYKEQGPMFPLYLFIYLSVGIDDWGPIRSTVGVSKLVRFGQIPARVPEEIIDALISREDKNGLQILPDKGYQPGDEVTIVDGPFQGYEGVICAKNSKERVIVLMKLIENFIKLELKANQLEPI